MADSMPQYMARNELRCKKCSRLLMKAENFTGAIEVKCGKCGIINVFSFFPLGKAKENEKTPFFIMSKNEFGNKKNQCLSINHCEGAWFKVPSPKEPLRVVETIEEDKQISFIK